MSSAMAQKLIERLSRWQRKAGLRDAARDRYAETLQLDRHFGGFDHHRDSIDDRSTIHIDVRFFAEQHHRNAPSRHDDISAAIDKATCLAFEDGLQFQLSRGRCESFHVIADISFHRADSSDPLLQPIATNLLAMGGYKGGVDRYQAELAAHAAGMEQGRFTQAKHWDFHRRSRLVQAHVLKVIHEKNVIALLLGSNGAAYHRARDAELRQRVHRRHRGRHGLEIEVEVGIRAGLHVRQQLRQVVAVANLISGALRPDAVSLRCVQFALLGIFNGRSRRTAAMRRTDSRFGLRRLQCRKGLEGRQPAAVWDDQITGKRLRYFRRLAASSKTVRSEYFFTSVSAPISPSSLMSATLRCSASRSGRIPGT